MLVNAITYAQYIIDTFYPNRRSTIVKLVRESRHPLSIRIYLSTGVSVVWNGFLAVCVKHVLEEQC